MSEWRPVRMYRVTDETGYIWKETENGREALVYAEEMGCDVERQFVRKEFQWKTIATNPE